MYISHSRSRQLQNPVAPSELFGSLSDHKKSLLNSASLSALTTQNVARSGNHAATNATTTTNSNITKHSHTSSLSAYDDGNSTVSQFAHHKQQYMSSTISSSKLSSSSSSVLSASQQLYQHRQQSSEVTSGLGNYRGAVHNHGAATTVQRDHHEEHFTSATNGTASVAAGTGQMSSGVPVSRGVKFPFKKPSQPAPISSATALYHFGADDDVRSSSSLSSGSSTPETPTRSQVPSSVPSAASAAVQSSNARTPLWKTMKIPKKVPAHALSTISSKNEIANKLSPSTTFSNSSQHSARNVGVGSTADITNITNSINNSAAATITSNHGYNNIQHRHRNLSSTPSPKSCPLLSNSAHLKRDALQANAFPPSSRHTSTSPPVSSSSNHFHTKHHSHHLPVGSNFSLYFLTSFSLLSLLLLLDHNIQKNENENHFNKKLKNTEKNKCSVDSSSFTSAYGVTFFLTFSFSIFFYIFNTCGFCFSPPPSLPHSHSRF